MRGLTIVVQYHRIFVVVLLVVVIPGGRRQQTGVVRCALAPFPKANDTFLVVGATLGKDLKGVLLPSKDVLQFVILPPQHMNVVLTEGGTRADASDMSFDAGIIVAWLEGNAAVPSGGRGFLLVFLLLLLLLPLSSAAATILCRGFRALLGGSWPYPYGTFASTVTTITGTDGALPCSAPLLRDAIIVVGTSFQLRSFISAGLCHDE